MKNRSFFKSVYHALEGFYNACLEERNLRFHIVIANLICVFAFFYGLGRNGWALLAAVITLVICMELLNTAVERAVDTATKEILNSAKLAKDASAAAVLFSAAGAVLAGVCLFGDVSRITYTLNIIFTDIKILIPCVLLGIADMCFLFGFKKRK